MTLDNDPVAIVGMGMRVPEADDIETFWKLLEEKRDLTRDIPKERFNSEFWCSTHKIKGSSVLHNSILLIGRSHTEEDL